MPNQLHTASLNELQSALNAAKADGNYAAVQELEQAIASKQKADNPYRTRERVMGSVADRERMARKPERRRQEFGNVDDYKKGLGRGAFEGVMMGARVLDNALPDKYVGWDLPGDIGPINLKPDVNRVEQEIPEMTGVSIPQPDPTTMSTLGMVTGAGGVYGLPNIAKATYANAGSLGGVRGLAGGTARNVGASTLSGAGSVAGGNLGANTFGEPGALVGSLLGAGAPALGVSAYNKVAGTTQASRAEAGRIGRGTVAQAKQLGVPVSAGTANPLWNPMERVLASIPGGIKVMHDFALKTNESLIKSLLRRTKGAADDIDTAGLMLDRGITNRVNKIRATGERLYNRANQLTNPATTVPANTFHAKLQEFLGGRIRSIDDVIVAIRGTSDDVLPVLDDALIKMRATQGRAHFSYAEANAIRQEIGRQLNKHSLLAPHPQQAELKALYGALADDIAGSLSGPAAKAWARANKYWSQSRKEVDKLLNPLANKGEMADIYDSVFAKNVQRTRTLNAVYSGMSPQERLQTTKLFLQRLGQIGDDVAQASDDVLSHDIINPNFNMAQFIRNWKRIPNKSKDILFRGQSDYRRNMEIFISYLGKLTQANKMFANPSQSGPIGLQASALFFGVGNLLGAGIGAMVGDEAGEGALKGAGVVSGAMMGTVLAARGMATMLTNPKMVEFLARGTRVPLNRAPEYFGRMAVVAQQDPQTAEAMNWFIQSIGELTSPDGQPQYGPRAY